MKPCIGMPQISFPRILMLVLLRPLLKYWSPETLDGKLCISQVETHTSPALPAEPMDAMCRYFMFLVLCFLVHQWSVSFFR